MCLGIPARITEAFDEGGLRMGKVDFGGAARDVCLEYVPEAEPGDYVIVHVGFAISVLDEQEAMETLAMLGEVLAADPEGAPPGSGALSADDVGGVD